MTIEKIKTKLNFCRKKKSTVRKRLLLVNRVLVFIGAWETSKSKTDSAVSLLRTNFWLMPHAKLRKSVSPFYGYLDKNDTYDDDSIQGISYHSIKLLTSSRTPPSRGRSDPKPLRHFDPLLPRIVYVAWLFDSCISLWDMVPNVKRR